MLLFCEQQLPEIVNLFDYLEGANSGGIWYESGSLGSEKKAFNDSEVDFSKYPIGEYSFIYQFEYLDM